MAQEASSVILPVGAETFSSGMMEAHRYMAWVLEPFRNYLGKKVLEVGCGHGGYGRSLKGLDTYVGLDISSELIEKLKRKHPETEYICADVTDSTVIADLAKRDFDTVICLNVLEHIEDHKTALESMMSCLRPGGHLLLFVPAYQSLYTEMDKLAGHFRRYRLGDFDTLISPASGEVVHSGYFNSLGGAGWFVNKLNKPKTLNDTSVNSQLVFFDRYLVPVARFMDFFTRKFFGQSLYVVVRKR